MKNVTEYLNSSLCEMAYSRKDFENKILSLGRIQQIIENWSLVRYCTLYDKKSQNKKHWSLELYNQLKPILNAYVKNIDKEKLVTKCLIIEPDINEPGGLGKHLYDKFSAEHINIECIPEIEKDILKHFKNIVKLISINKANISSHDEEKLRNYCYNEI